jgi:hypothetical protein
MTTMARAEEGTRMTSGMKPSTMAVGAAGGCGCLALPVGVTLTAAVLLIVGRLGVLLLPLVIIFMIFHGLSLSGLGSIGQVNDDLTPVEQLCENAERQRDQSDQQNAEDVGAIATGDGLGQLELSPPDADGNNGNQPCTVPENLYKSIEDAGGICDVIGPVIIAAQIQYESGFDPKYVGSNGAEGISQVPRDVFMKLMGNDADPFDPKQSIKAQGTYLCELAGQVKDLEDRNMVTGNVLDLTLAAYDVGLDAVEQAKGVPATDEAQRYITGVRTWFAPMEGIGPPPRKLADIPDLRHDGGVGPSASSSPS